jgi:hypothetical protein
MVDRGRTYTFNTDDFGKRRTSRKIKEGKWANLPWGIRGHCHWFPYPCLFGLNIQTKGRLKPRAIPGSHSLLVRVDRCLIFVPRIRCNRQEFRRSSGPKSSLICREESYPPPTSNRAAGGLCVSIPSEPEIFIAANTCWKKRSTHQAILRGKIQY